MFLIPFFEEIISDDKLASNGIPTKLMELFNNFIRIIDNEELEIGEKKELVKVIIKQLINEVLSSFNNERIIRAIDKLKFSQY